MFAYCWNCFLERYIERKFLRDLYDGILKGSLDIFTLLTAINSQSSHFTRVEDRKCPEKLVFRWVNILMPKVAVMIFRGDHQIVFKHTNF